MKRDIYGVTELYEKMREISKEVCKCGCAYDPFKECSTKSRIISDMYELSLMIGKRYDQVDKIKEKIMNERLYKALLYTDIPDDNVYLDILDGDDAKLTECMFVTFNPSPQQDFQTCFDAVERYLKLKYIKKGLFVVEQRAEDFMMLGKGYHFHLLVWHDCPKLSHFKRDARRVFQSYCDVEKSGCLNFRSNKTQRDIDNRTGYLLGDKLDPAKKEKQDGDRVFRERHNIQQYYTYNFPLK